MAAHAGHHHSHVHAHAHGSHDRAFAIGVALNLAFVAVEAGYGIAADSVALLADAGHNLSDVLGLLVAWGGAWLALRSPSRTFTYGLKGSSILAALFNAIILLLTVGGLMVESTRRLFDPQPVDGQVVMIVAAIGVVINGATAVMFARGRHGDLNLRGAFLHMVADALLSAGVVVAGFIVWRTALNWIDPLVSIAVALVILWGTFGLLKDALGMSLGAVPPGLDPDAVRGALASLPGVARVHDLHIWSMSTTERALTAHLVMPDGHPGDTFLRDTHDRLAHDFGIGHATLQVELDSDCGCALARSA
jgi:cobalt-zinc-cadmium efflux system protein